MKNEFKNSIKNIPEVIKLIIIYSIINLGILYYIYSYLKNDFETFIFIGSLILLFYFGTIILPVIILFNNYNSKTKNISLELNEEYLRINNNSILVKDIKKIVINGTNQHFKGLGSGGISTLPYNDSFYFLEVFVGDKIYYLTSLLSYDIDLILINKYPSINFIKKINSFPIISDTKKL